MTKASTRRWFQPIWKILVKLDHLPRYGKNISNHHLGDKNNSKLVRFYLNNTCLDYKTKPSMSPAYCSMMFANGTHMSRNRPQIPNVKASPGKISQETKQQRPTKEHFDLLLTCVVLTCWRYCEYHSPCHCKKMASSQALGQFNDICCNKWSWHGWLVGG